MVHVMAVVMDTRVPVTLDIPANTVYKVCICYSRFLQYVVSVCCHVSRFIDSNNLGVATTITKPQQYLNWEVEKRESEREIV